jgi:hypothetical protein
MMTAFPVDLSARLALLKLVKVSGSIFGNPVNDGLLIHCDDLAVTLDAITKGFDL